jgi:DNA-binding transcriptional MocR family regulator
LRPLGPGFFFNFNFLKEILSVETDHHGIIPESLESVLEERKKSKKSMPKFLYTIPHSSNPSGATIPDSRKKLIYEMASIFNFLILEDDPYFYLTYGSELSSFLKFDNEGRVLRFDSLSKILSSGLRLVNESFKLKKTSTGMVHWSK